MLVEIRDTLIEEIKSALPEIEKVDNYKGEFEEGTDWNPTSTACFIHVLSYKPAIKASDGSTLKAQTFIKIYSGANTKHDKDALELTEQLLNLLSNASITITEGAEFTRLDMMLIDDGMDFINYIKGFEAYSFIIMIT